MCAGSSAAGHVPDALTSSLSSVSGAVTAEHVPDAPSHRFLLSEGPVVRSTAVGGVPAEGVFGMARRLEPDMCACVDSGHVPKASTQVLSCTSVPASAGHVPEGLERALAGSSSAVDAGHVPDAPQAGASSLAGFAPGVRSEMLYQ